MVSRIMLALALIIGSCLIAFPLVRATRVTTDDNANQLSQDKALGIVRTIGSAEATFNAIQHRYGSLQELIDGGMLGFTNGFSLEDNNSATLKNFKLSIVPSADGKHFQVSLVPKSPCEAVSLFTNEAFVIYQAKPIGGCPAS